MKTMRLWMCVVCGLLFASGLYARKTGVLDEIVFGHSASEKKHGFSAKASQVVTGGLEEEARVLLPIPGERVEGGHITFTMKVRNRIILRPVSGARTAGTAISSSCFARGNR